ncbi:hypothetical protein [Corticicoccus populi]|uniref:Glycosyltransferase RgtA/B/C/D-like domain-containing protein n=1 Tax=Corticicoccus populi TaxID=1812821 RepID=A0ABW5WV82_9STAP
MFIIWVTLILILSISYIFNILMDSTLYITAGFIMSVSLFFMFTLMKNYTRFFLILFTSFLVRLLFLFIDVFNLYALPHTGDDTENFYKTGQLIGENLYLLQSEVYGGIYSKFLGVIFNIYGDDRIFAQFLNIIFAMTAILLMIEIFKKLEIPVRVQMICVALMAFFPHSLIFSSILLRESLISLFVVLSLYFFISWFKGSKGIHAVVSVLFLVVAALFHSAVIGAVIGYVYAFIFYDRTYHRFNVSLRSVIPFVLFTGFFIYILTFPEVIENWPLFNKFSQSLNQNDNLYEAFTSTRGEAAYLTNININNMFQLILFTPVKVIYFIGSPMPWSFRNLNDILSFFLDGVFYLSVLAVGVRHFPLIRKHPLLFIIMISIAAGWIVFGLGISNAGTAIRHRFKFFYMVVVFLSVFLTKKDE